MPLAACAPRGTFSADQAAAPGSVTRRFVLATNGTGPELGQRSDTLSFWALDVALAPGRAPGTVPTTGPTAFATTRMEQIAPDDLVAQAGRFAAGEPLVIWIHGYNNTAAEAVYRHAQMAEDIGMSGPQLSFAWPSDATARGYLHDRDSLLDARRPLADLLGRVRRNWSGQILVIAHSLGTHLAMEALARRGLRGQSAAATVDGLIFLQPDMDPDVFRELTRDAAPLPDRAVVVAALDDPVLRLSARLSQTPVRLGAGIAGAEAAGFEVLDLTGIRDAQNRHLVALSSPQMLTLLSETYAQAVETGFAAGVPRIDLANARRGAP